MFYQSSNNQPDNSFREEGVQQNTRVHLLASSYDPPSHFNADLFELEEWPSSSMPPALDDSPMQQWDDELQLMWNDYSVQPENFKLQQPPLSDSALTHTAPSHTAPLHSASSHTQQNDVNLLTQQYVDYSLHSPRSVASTESSLISPPQQFQANLAIHSEDKPSIPSSVRRRRRSSSMPPNFIGVQHHPPPSGPPAHIPFSYGPKFIQIDRAPTTPSRPIDTEKKHRKLVERLKKVDLEDITVAELKDILRELGLSCAGRKADLISRLCTKRDDVLIHKTPGLPWPATHPSLGSPYTRSRVVKRPPPPNLYRPQQQHHTPRNLLSSPQFKAGLPSIAPNASPPLSPYMPLSTPPSYMTAAIDIGPSAMTGPTAPPSHTAAESNPGMSNNAFCKNEFSITLN